MLDVLVKLNALFFFALVCLITFQFSKNMAVVLLIGVIATNFAMSNKLMREGLENQSSTTTTNTTTSPSTTTSSTTTPPSTTSSTTSPSTTTSSSNDLNDDTTTKIMDSNNKDLNNNVSKDAPEGIVQTANKKGKSEEHFGSRIDYASTIEQSYQNLDQLLGNDSIKQLTSDTQNLMKQQQNLFDTMQNMVPVLEGAKDMLKNFDIGSLTSSLKGLETFGKPKTN
jgi:hypothetical protein